MMKMVTHDSVSEDLRRAFREWYDRKRPRKDDICKAFHLRRLPKPHGVVAFAHYLIARTVQELSQPADTAHKEAGVDVEEDDGRVAVGVLPVSKKGGLKMKKKMISGPWGHFGELWVVWSCLTRVKKVQRRVMVPK